MKSTQQLATISNYDAQVTITCAPQHAVFHVHVQALRCTTAGMCIKFHQKAPTQVMTKLNKQQPCNALTPIQHCTKSRYREVSTINSMLHGLLVLVRMQGHGKDAVRTAQTSMDSSMKVSRAVGWRLCGGQMGSTCQCCACPAGCWLPSNNSTSLMFFWRDGTVD